jgi:hypothetical protein
VISTKAGRALEALIKLFTDKTAYYAHVRYRVAQRQGDRWDLQAVKKGVWPDQTFVSVMPGAAGYKADLPLGSIVLAVFPEGDMTLKPVITHFAGPDQERFIPLTVEIAGNDKAVSGVGDQVAFVLPPGIPITVITAAGPAQGTITSPVRIVGSIQTGSTKVKMGA